MNRKLNSIGAGILCVLVAMPGMAQSDIGNEDLEGELERSLQQAADARREQLVREQEVALERARAMQAETERAVRELEQARAQLEEAAQRIAISSAPVGSGRYKLAGLERELAAPRVQALGPNVEIARAINLSRAPWGDMELVTMTAALGRYFQTTEGLLVVRAPEQPAIDIEDGDVILTISGRTPNSPEHAIRILGSFEPGEQVEFELMRDGQRAVIEYLVPSAPAVVVPVPPDTP
jgi:hypothetical protein